jgi:predicted CoA-binding protein
MNQLIRDFLSQKHIGVAGVSRNPRGSAANFVYRKLRASGYQVFAINPNASTVEGDPCYPDLRSIPAKVDAVLIATTPQVCEQIVRQCGNLGVRHVWMHRSLGTGSVSQEAVAFCRENQISVIAGGCPMMHCEPVDFGHKCMRWVLRLFGGLSG